MASFEQRIKAIERWIELIEVHRAPRLPGDGPQLFDAHCPACGVDCDRAKYVICDNCFGAALDVRFGELWSGREEEHGHS